MAHTHTHWSRARCLLDLVRLVAVCASFMRHITHMHASRQTYEWFVYYVGMFAINQDMTNILMKCNFAHIIHLGILLIWKQKTVAECVLPKKKTALRPHCEMGDPSRTLVSSDGVVTPPSPPSPPTFHSVQSPFWSHKYTKRDHPPRARVVIHTYEYGMSHISIQHVTHRIWCHTYEYVMSHIWIRHDSCDALQHTCGGYGQ